MDLPADGHVHSQFSWDADRGAMDATCSRAVALGLPAIAFTEHVDPTPFRAGFLAERFGHLVHDGVLTAPELDVEGYLETVEQCRARHPGLTILTGIEVGQPHLRAEEIDALLARGSFDRVLGSLHCLPDGDVLAEPWELFPHRPAAEVFRAYLAEVPAVVAGSSVFTSFAHLDYPVRSWPEDARPFDPADYEDELRHALRALAEGDRALEVNARLPLHPTILRWWPQEGGRLVTFGSDAHEPATLADGLRGVAEMAAAQGFSPDSRPAAPWRWTG